MTTREVADALRDQIARDEYELKKKREILARIVGSCNHVWSEPTQGYTDKLIEVADPSKDIRKGSDFYPGFTCVVRSVPCWTKTCSKCGEKRETTEVTEKTEVRLVPKF